MVDALAQTAGAVRSAHGALSVTTVTLTTVDCPLPLPPVRYVVEQQKIADCLGSLDDLIAAEGRKLEALRQHKQGLMQQLFPQPGETQPRLRFIQSFARAPDWEQAALGRSWDRPPEYGVNAAAAADLHPHGPTSRRWSKHCPGSRRVSPVDIEPSDDQFASAGMTLCSAQPGSALASHTTYRVEDVCRLVRTFAGVN